MKTARTLVLALLISFSGNFHILANEAVSRKILDSGLVVLAKERSPKDIVTVCVSVKAAPRYEDKYLGSGISHLVEHMLFKGTALRKPGDIEKEIRSWGGAIDGAVSSDFTSYQLTVPSKELAKALALLKDMLLNASFDPVELVREKDVILKEVRLNRDDPEKRSILSLFFNSYSRHPYRYPPIGYEDALKSLSREDLLKYYNARYIPNNIVIAVAGDANEKEAISLVESEFKDFRKSDYGLSDVCAQEGRQLGKRSVEEDAATTLSYISIGFHSTSILDRDLFAADLLSMILGRGDNSRLNRALVLDKRIAHSASATNFTPADPGLFIISAITYGDNLEASRMAIMEEAARIRQEGVTDKELDAAKKMVLADYILSRETVEEDAKDLCENETLTGNYDFSARYIEGIKKTTPRDIKRAAMRYLNEDDMTEVIIRPKAEKALPDVRVPKAASEGKMEKKTLPNGLTVITRPDTKVPAVSITVAFSGGLSAESRDNNGISDLVSKMLLDGTRDKKGTDITGSIESRGGSISAFSGFDNFGINIVVLKDDLDNALDLVKEIVLDSVLPQDEIAKEKMLAIASIKAQDEDIFQKGVYIFKKALFADHPYAMRYSGEMETVSALKRENLIKFYHDYCVPNNMVISVSGDIDAGKVAQKVEDLFKSASRRDLPKIASTADIPARVNKEAMKMDKEQALLMVGFKTVGVNDPDRYTLDMIETLLSGISGRLFASIRDKAGLSYALGCTQKLGVKTGFILFYVATTKDKVALAREKLFGEIKLIRDIPVTEEELDFAKKEAINNYKITMQANSVYAFQSALDELRGPGYDNLYKYEDGIRRVTREDIKRVCDKYLDLNAYTEVVIEQE